MRNQSQQFFIQSGVPNLEDLTEMFFRGTHFPYFCMRLAGSIVAAFSLIPALGILASLFIY